MKAKQKSEDFIQALFRDHNTGLLRFLTRKLSDPEEAADVAQSAYQKMMSVEEPEVLQNAKSYLYQTAMNLAIDRIRKAQRRDSHLRSMAQDIEQGEGTACPSPEKLVATREELERVNAAIHTLPEKCKRAFLMHRSQHMTYAEIGEALEVSVSMVEKYIIQALKHLREKLK